MEFTLRTYCQAIVSFNNKKPKNKLSSDRWLTFVDYIIGNGFHITIEHIKGINNFLTDILSIIIQDTYQTNHK